MRSECRAEAEGKHMGGGGLLVSRLLNTVGVETQECTRQTHLSLGKQMSPLIKPVRELQGVLLAAGVWMSWSG